MEAEPITLIHYHYEVSFDKSIENFKRSKDPSKAAEKKAPVDEETANANIERFFKRNGSLIFQEFVKVNSNVFAGVPYCYDGLHNVYTVKSLAVPKLEKKLAVSIEGRTKDFLVSVKQVNVINTSDIEAFFSKKCHDFALEAVTGYEIVFNHMLAEYFTKYQGKFFDLQKSSRGRVEYVEFIQGFVNSVRPTEFGLAQNIHLKTTCTINKDYKSVLDLCSALMRCPANNMNFDFGKLNKMLRHLKIFTNHTKNRNFFTIGKIIPKSSAEEVFSLDKENDKKITYKAYFERQYGLNLRFPHYPLVELSGKGAGTSRARRLPIELCMLVPSQFLKNTKYGPDIHKELLLKSTHAPNVYFNTVAQTVDKMSTLDPKFLSSFGISVKTPPVKFYGRELIKPAVIPLAAGPRAPPKFQETSKLNFAVFCLDAKIDKRAFDQFCQRLNQCAVSFFPGSKLFASSLIDKPPTPDLIKNVLLNCKKNIPNVNLVFIGIAPYYGNDMPSDRVYSMIKHYSDQVFGLVTQCFNTKNVVETPGGYFETMLFKDNGKVGGVCSTVSPACFQKLDILGKNTMVVGLDVNHPGETESVESSISAAVGSYDQFFCKYSASIRVQERKRDEMIDNLDEMIEELLNEYKKVNRTYPSSLIIMRDGLSEGQFDAAMEKEVSLIQKAVNKLMGKGRITYVVVQKRHNTRFVRTTAVPAGKRDTYNVPQGTVVDTVIVDPRLKSFYLNSHFSPLGTSKPTKYVVLRDDHDFKMDAIQNFCYYLCFNCIRTSKVISIPSPIRYADLCAYRAKLHLLHQFEQNKIIPTRNQEEFGQAVIGQLNGFVKTSDLVKSQLYYC